MEKRSITDGIVRTIDICSTTYRYLGYASMVLMSLIVTIDVLGRFVFNAPLKGGPEIVEELMVCVIFFMLPYVTRSNRHIKVDVIVERTSKLMPRTQWFSDLVFDVLILIFLVLLSWAGFTGAIGAFYNGETTDSLRIPHYPFRYVLAIGFSLAFITLLLNIVRNISIKVKGY